MRALCLLAVAALLQDPAPPRSESLFPQRVQSFHANGRLAAERFYANEVKVGRHRAFWEDGTLRFEATFVSGDYDGVVRTFYTDGRPFEIRHYVRGEEDGPQQIFEPDGRFRTNYVVRDGRRYGVVGSRPCATVRGGVR